MAFQLHLFYKIPVFHDDVLRNFQIYFLSNKIRLYVRKLVSQRIALDVVFHDLSFK